MKLYGYAVRDTKAEAFTRPPFFASNKAVVIRAFTEMVNDPSQEVGKYPADFTLFEIGEFDQLTGVLVPRPQGILDLGNGLAYVNDSPALNLKVVK